jgi:hypothetical protein
MKERAISAHLAGAALFAGVAAWALQQQGGYVAASWMCGNQGKPMVWLLTVAALVLLAAGSWLSWHTLRPLLHDDRTEDSDISRPRRFLSLVALLAALLFLFAVLMQAAAAIFLPGCVG